jgi:rifampin ADP-ribosylating transferase
MTMTEEPNKGPFFHGTIANLRVGDFLNPGRRSNYRPEVVMNHIYFTALVDGAGLAAEIAAELAGGDAVPRVYAVEPTGPFEDDPNVTDKKFSGNPTRSYRSSAPLKVIGEITEWTRLTPEALQLWRERLIKLPSDQRGEIINRCGGDLQRRHSQRQQAERLMDTVVEQGFIETLEHAARLLNLHATPWMVFGGAAMVLYGFEQGPVADIDIILPSQAAGLLSAQFSWRNHADGQSPRFRSDYVLRPDLGPVPVELLGGFRIWSHAGWTEVGASETRELHVGSQPVFLPSRERLAAIFRSCGREKDLRRAARLKGDD